MLVRPMILEKPLHTGAGFSMVFCGGATAIFHKKCASQLFGGFEQLLCKCQHLRRFAGFVALLHFSV
jgi:predicted phage tail protein